MITLQKIWHSNQIKDFNLNMHRWRDYCGQNLVLTGGFFDPIHSGHINLLKNSIRHGDMLVVAVNGYEACLRKKEYEFMTIESRLEIIAAISYVDFVVENVNDDMTKIIEIVKPVAYTKGGDVTEDTLNYKERILCEKMNVKVIYDVGGGKTQSSSDLVERVCRDYVSRYGPL